MPFFNPKRIAPDGTWRAQALHRASAILPRGMLIPVLQGPLRGKWWTVGSAAHACWLGTYEPDESTLLMHGIRPRQVVFDLGAQAGYHTLHAAILVGPEGRVYAFEPNPLNARYLRKHAELNSLS